MRLVVAINARSYDQLLRSTTDRTINQGVRRLIVRSILASCDGSYEQSCDYRSTIIHNWSCHHARLVVRSSKTYLRPLTILNRRLEVLNMTIDLAVTDFPLAITTTSATNRAFFLRYVYDSKLFWSQLRRKLVVSPL